MGIKKKRNSRKEQFLNDVSLPSIFDTNLADRCKFNFSYLDESQEGAQSIADWNQDGKKDASLENLMRNLKEYTTESLTYWKNQSRLTIYGRFPKEKSDFKHPKNVPHEVSWGRFRVAGKVRIAGFVIPDELAEREYTDSKGKKFKYCTNTFYVVFLDKDHLFYKVAKKHT